MSIVRVRGRVRNRAPSPTHPTFRRPRSRLDIFRDICNDYRAGTLTKADVLLKCHKAGLSPFLSDPAAYPHHWTLGIL